MTLKSLSSSRLAFVEDLSREFPRINPIVLEKDEFVTEVLSALSSIDHPDFKLVFCGGTCLSKSYKILERMSEDVDFKIERKSEDTPISKTKLREGLSLFMKDIRDALIKSGWSEEAIEKRSRDNNTYTKFELKYLSRLSGVSVTRPHIQLELNYTPIVNEVSLGTITNMVDDMILFQAGSQGALAIQSPQKKVTIISLEEALAEKLISFPRRLMKQLTKDPSWPPEQALSEENGWDKALVRHLYDVHQIMLKTDNSVSPRTVLPFVIEKDQQDFKNQDNMFVDDPWGQLEKALRLALGPGDVQVVLKKQYDQFVQDMVYAQVSPSYEEALEVFSKVLLNERPSISPKAYGL